MKGINTLIKLSKRKLDELRRNLAGLENQKDQLLQAISNLQAELRREIELAGQQTEMRGFFGGFAKRIQTRQEQITIEVMALEKRMEMIRVEISDAFAELKKYEIAKENAKLREIAEQKRKETLMLDEVAGQQFHRRNHTENT